jgi:NitT/TauT family transport system permease protein
MSVLSSSGEVGRTHVIVRPPHRVAAAASAVWRQRYRLVAPVIIVVVWEWFARSGALPSALLPAPSDAVMALLDWMFAIDGSAQAISGHWLGAALASATRVFAGYAIASAVGITLGLAIGWSRFCETVFDPTIQLLRPIPPISWVPLAIMWFGIANKPAIFLVFLGTVFPILMNTTHGVRTVNRDLLRAAAMMGATNSQLLRYVVLPAALPSIFAGLRIGIGVAWMLTVTAEMVAVKSGLGYQLWDSYYFMQFNLVVAAMISIGVLGFVSDLSIKALMNRVLHWQRGTTVAGLRI